MARTAEEWNEKHADADDSEGPTICEQCRLPHADWELERGECVECGMKPLQCIGCLITLSRRDISDVGYCGACEFRRGSDIGISREIGERV